MNNLLLGKDSTKHPALPGQAAVTLASTGRSQEWFCQPGFDMHGGEFCSEGHGTPAKGLAPAMGTRVRAMEPLGSQGARAWLPALLGHGAAWYRDPPWAAPAPHPPSQERRFGLGTGASVPGQPHAITHCQRCLCSPTAPCAIAHCQRCPCPAAVPCHRRHKRRLPVGVRRVPLPPGEPLAREREGSRCFLAAGQVSTGQHVPWGCGGADGGMWGPGRGTCPRHTS